ncbi:hypothetical protein GJAV_G00009780 [Gymnothorax javanicus]|nr:hypothetical protein GJAV_G00009780 [Gymnothorax javanicus]
MPAQETGGRGSGKSPRRKRVGGYITSALFTSPTAAARAARPNNGLLHNYAQVCPKTASACQKMGSQQYFKGFILLLILEGNIGLVSGQTTSEPYSDSSMASMSPWTDSGWLTPTNNPSTTMSKVQISCRQFTCDDSMCYKMFMNETAMACDPSVSYCTLNRLTSMRYSVNCSANCPSTRCANMTQTGCSVDCCNTTNCLNGTLFAMVPTTAAPTTTKSATTVRTPAPPATNGKKCHNLMCDGETCYKTANNRVVMCLVGKDYCQVKKVVNQNVMTWTAGCSGDCRDDTVCTSTTTDCTQECCNATSTSSCLKLDGSINMPNSAPIPVFSAALSLGSSILAWLIVSNLNTL